jgi:hypothetical protein
VHPEDEPVFAESPAYRDHFNLDFPPPAYVGDVENAPVIVLMANGGCSDLNALRLEFRTPVHVTEYIARLRKPRPADPRYTSPYYQAGVLGERLASGDACVVNALAYRSREMTDSIRRIAEKLPSVAAHREWLTKVAIPAAREGQRAIIAKRPGLWSLGSTAPNGLFPDHPGTRHVSAAAWDWADTWIKEAMISFPFNPT